MYVVEIKEEIMKKPVVAVPIGDPASIGPEIVLKAFQDKSLYEVCCPVIVGSKGVLKKTCEFIQSHLLLNPVKNVASCAFEYGTADFIDLDNIDAAKITMGEVQDFCGKASYEYFAAAIDLALNEEADAVATSTLNKESMKLADIHHIGHTEILEHLTGVHDPLTMFQTDDLRIFFLSRHVSLRQAIDLVKEERVYDYIVRSCNSLKLLGLEEITLAVAGLNPHSSDNGLFGHEEKDEIIPAIKRAVSEGYSVAGPVPADSVFHQAAEGRYTAVLALYHDQGHIAAKMHDFHRTVSITLGAPFLRTSVDHGTAYDIAGKGIANEQSMVQAILAAGSYAHRYNSLYKSSMK